MITLLCCLRLWSSLPRALRLLPGALLLAAFPAGAQPAPDEAVRTYLEKAATGLPGRVEVIVGALDSRLQLAPCARVEPYLPAGTRLWGKAQIGLRCAAGANWNVFLPVEVRIFARALADAAGRGATTGAAAMVTTAAGHRGGSAGGGIAPTLQFRGASQGSIDGNSVEMDAERAAFADNAVRYEASLRFLNGQIRSLVSAITG